MPVLPQLGPAPGTALSRRQPTPGPPPHGTQEEKKMKGDNEDGPQEEAASRFECNEGDLQESASCNFVEHPKDITENIPQESSEEESDSVFVDKVQKTRRESSEDESVASRDIAEPKKVRTKIMYLPATQSLRNEPVANEKAMTSTQKAIQPVLETKGSEVKRTKKLLRSDEVTSDDEKDSCSEESSESHEDIPYSKLPHSLPTEALSNKSLSIESDDQDIDKETAILTTQPVVASAAITALFSAFSPMSRGKNNSEVLKCVDKNETKAQLPKSNQRKHESAVIVPLHGSSVEEECFSNEEKENPHQENANLHKKEVQNIISDELDRTSFTPLSQENPIEVLEPVVDEGDGLIQSIPSASCGVNYPSTLKEGASSTRQKPIFLKLPHESEVIVSPFNVATSREAEEAKTGESLTPELSNLQTIQRIYGKKERKKPRIFKKVPNENAVFVPLHSSSDEDENTFREDISDTYKKLETSEVEGPVVGQEDYPTESGEYLIYVPLVDEKSEAKDKEQSKQTANEEQFAASHPSIATAAFTSLFSAFSPLGSHDAMTNTNEINLEDNQHEIIDEPVKPNKNKPKLFKKVPNENAVIIPLHSSSEEDYQSEVGNTGGSFEYNTNEQQISEYIEKSEIENNNDIDKNCDNQPSPVSQQQQASVITQPSVATAAYTALFSAFSPLGTHGNLERESQNNDNERNESMDVQKPKKKKIFKKLPNENAYFIPLHSSSEEDHQGEESTEVNQAPTLEEPSSENKPQASGKNDITYSQEDENGTSHESLQEMPPVNSKDTEIVIGTPTVATAAFSSLFSAFSPLARTESSEQAKINETEDNLSTKNTEEEENTARRKKSRPRIFKKVPNEDAVFIPLHSSEEDILQEEDQHINLVSNNNNEGLTDESNTHLMEMEIEEPNKYSVYVPLKDESKDKAQLLTTRGEQDLVIETPTIASAAFSSLFSAFSPLGSSESAVAQQENAETNNEKAANSNIEDNEVKVIKKKPKIYKKVPNQDAVYIPLHSSEEDVLQDDEEKSESKEQRLPEKDLEVPKLLEHDPLKDDINRNVDEFGTKSEENTFQGTYREKELIINTPSIATAAFSSLFSAFSPLGSSELASEQQGTLQDGNNKEPDESIPHTETSGKNDETRRRKKPKIYKKVPNEDAVYIPLHSSEEDVLQSEESLNESFQRPVANDHEEPKRYEMYVTPPGEEEKNSEDIDATEEEAHRIEEVALKNPALASAAFNSFFHAVSPLGSSQNPSNEDQSKKYILRTHHNSEEEKQSINMLEKDPHLVTTEDELGAKEPNFEDESLVLEESFVKKFDDNKDDKDKSTSRIKREKVDVKKENVILSQPSVATAAFTALYSASISPAPTPVESTGMSVHVIGGPDFDSENNMGVNDEITLASSEAGSDQAVIEQENAKNQQENLTGDNIFLDSYEKSLSNISQTTVATAAFTSLFTALSPLGEKVSESGKVDGNETSHLEEEISTTKPIRRKQRIFKKVPNENAVYVPLHSSSEEEKSCEEEGNGDEIKGDTNNLHEPDKPNEYKIFVPLNEDDPKRREEKIRNQTPIEISQPSVATAAFTALFSAFSPLGSTEQMRNSDVCEFPSESVSNDDQQKKPRPVFKKIPNEDAYIIPLKASFEEDDIVNKEGNNGRMVSAEGDENLKISDLSENYVERTDILQTITKDGDNKKSRIEVTAENVNNIATGEIEESKQKNNLIQEMVSATENENNLNKIMTKDDIPKEKKSVVKSILKKTKSGKEIGPDREIGGNEAQINSEIREKTVQIEEPITSEIAIDKAEAQSKKDNGNKSISEQVLKKEPKKVKVKEIDVQAKPQKTFKLADIVLDVLTKKEKNKAEEAGAKEKPLEETFAGQNIQGTTSCDHEYEPIQAPRAASQPDVRSSSLEIKPRREQGDHLKHKEEVQLNESKEEPLSLKEQVRQKEKEEEDRYEVVRPPEGPAIQEATLSLQADGGYEVIEEPRKEQRRCIKIPDEDAIIVPLHGSSDEEINPDRYQNPALMMSEEEIESFPKQPLPYVNIPSKNKQQKNNEEGTFQDKLKNQADRFTTKLRGISKPKIVIHKPKIKLPERPKMPEMPKMKLPERPKFNLPNRPKFNLPERPKFHLPDKSKFHLPEKPKFLTERPKFLSERPKFLSERPSFKLPERFTRHEKKPKAPKGKKPNPSSQRRPLRDVVTISSQSTPGSTQNIFETLKFKTYPRFFKKKKAPPIQKMSSLDTESSQPSTPPRRPRRFSDQPRDVGWVHAYDRDIKFADEETQLRIERMEEEYVREDCGQFQDNFEEDITNLEEEELQKGKAESMTSVVSEKGSSGSSSNRRRAGVIEEIDSDEFFVRQKGLSREDVDVSRYLSLEIRDAFRQPKNALASLDNEMYDEERAPRAPERRRSQKSDHFHTFPKRPSRRKESDPEPRVKPPRRFRSKSGGRSRQSSMPSLSIEPLPQPPSRKSRERSLRSLNKEGRASDLDIVQPRISAQNSGDIPPIPPLRKSRSRGTSLADDDRTSRGADSLILPDDELEVPQPPLAGRELDDEMMMDEEIEDVEEEAPVKQIKIIPSRTQEVIEIEDRYNTDNFGYAVVSKDRKKPPRPPPPPNQHFDFHSQLDSIKATGKNIFFTYPRRAMKSLHKPFPQRPLRNYNTLGPVRPPRRNRVFRKPVYMTGELPTPQETFIEKERDLQSGEVVSRMKGRPLPPPPRPPRKSREYDELIGEINESSPTETLVATTEVEVIKEEEPVIKETRKSYFQTKKDEFLQTMSRYSPFESKKEEETKEQTTTGQQTSFDYGEVSVSIQTDPLPKDVIVIDQEIEETEEILILSDSNGKEFKDEKKEVKNLEEKEIPDEIKKSKSAEDIQVKENEESIESNIFQQALERVEAARGVLKEARERVIPGSTNSLDERKMGDENESHISRINLRGSLPTSSRSEGIEKEETPPPLPARPHYTKPIPVSFPDKLHLSELDVDKLNVSEIQANRIKVSEIESTCIDVTDLTSRGGNLTLNGLELPPDFISNVVAQVTSQVTTQVASQVSSQVASQVSSQVASQVSSQVQSQISQQIQSLQSQRELTPQRQVRRVLTPPPSIVVQASSEPISAPEPMIPQTQITEHIPQPKTTRSKGRKSPTRVIDDSEDELASIMPQRRNQEKEKKIEQKQKSEIKKEDKSRDGKKGEKKSSEEQSGEVEKREVAKVEDPEVPSPSIDPSLEQASSLQLLRRLLSIWQRQLFEGAGSFVEGVNALFPDGEKRRDAQVAAVILLILITGLILIGFGFDHSVHHHHWDYLPPR